MPKDSPNDTERQVIAAERWRWWWRRKKEGRSGGGGRQARQGSVGRGGTDCRVEIGAKQSKAGPVSRGLIILPSTSPAEWPAPAKLSSLMKPG
jgi:hypothetical protein